MMCFLFSDSECIDIARSENLAVAWLYLHNDLNDPLTCQEGVPPIPVAPRCLHISPLAFMVDRFKPKSVPLQQP
jgi:hypothetical protein